MGFSFIGERFLREPREREREVEGMESGGGEGNRGVGEVLCWGFGSGRRR